MTSRTSEMKAMCPRVWGYEKVQVFFGSIRLSKNQDIVVAGDLIRSPDGRLWEFVNREGDKIRGMPVDL